jgi:cytoskeleton protein RodZ
MTALETSVASASNDNVNLVTPGQRLRIARESLSFTVDDIADRMRLRADVVIDIENDDYDAIKRGAVFIRGYLRGYAKLVDLNGDEVISVFDRLYIEEVPSTVHVVPAATQSSQPFSEDYLKWGAAGLVLFTLLVLVTYILMGRSEKTEPVAAPVATQAETESASTPSVSDVKAVAQSIKEKAQAAKKVVKPAAKKGHNSSHSMLDLPAEYS